MPGRGSRISRLGLVCELDSVSADGRSASFAVAEYAVFADERRLILHDDRGWGDRIHQTGPPDPDLNYWTHVTIESLVDTALLVLIPDEGDPADEHDWTRLVALFAEIDVTTTRAQLRSLPYVVEFGDKILARFGTNTADFAPIMIDWDKR